MRVSEQTKAEIAGRLDIIELVSGYVPLNRKQGRYWGLCPFHQEKTPSFSVVPEKGIYYCFGCHKGGDIYNFVMEMEKLTFPEALRFLAEKAGVELQAEEGDFRPSQREAFLELHRRVAGSFHYIFMNRPQAAEARAYLQRRGFTQDTMVRYQVGYAPEERDWLWQFLREKDYSEEFLKSSGLFFERDGRILPYFWGRVIFPIENARGEVLAFGGRSLGDRGPKYLNSPETPFFRKGEHLFGLRQALADIKERGEFILVEGYLDVLALSQCGVRTAVAPLGTALTEAQVRLLKRYSGRALLLFDGDEAGLRATRRAAELLERQDIEALVVELPPGRDPADIMQGEASDAEARGGDTLQDFLKCPINSFQFLLQKALALYDHRTPDGKEKIVQSLASYIAATDSQVRRDGYFHILADTLEVGFDSVRHDVARGPGKPVRRPPGPPAEAGPHGPVHDTAELFLMMATAANQELFATVRNRLTMEDLEDPRARELFIALEESYRGEERTLAALLERIETPALRTRLLERVSAGEFAIQPELVVQDGIQSIRRRNLERRRDQLDSLLARSAPSDLAALKELLTEKMYLDQELESMKVHEHDRSAE